MSWLFGMVWIALGSHINENKGSNSWFENPIWYLNSQKEKPSSAFSVMDVNFLLRLVDKHPQNRISFYEILDHFEQENICRISKLPKKSPKNLEVVKNTRKRSSMTSDKYSLKVIPPNGVSTRNKSMDSKAGLEIKEINGKQTSIIEQDIKQLSRRTSKNSEFGYLEDLIKTKNLKGKTSYDNLQE